MESLNLFYEEPDPDRWLPYDRYPRRIIRRIVRGKPRPGGQTRVFLNLCAGLDKLGVAYRVNDYRYIQKHADEVACIIGKPHILDKIHWKNPILFGAAVFSHPTDDLNLFDRLPVRRMLVPGEWMRKMCEPYYGDRVLSWPIGIDTDHWLPMKPDDKTIDVLLYDKVRWEHDKYEEELIQPIYKKLSDLGLSVETIRYGSYKEEDFHHLLDRSKGMIFLCEHETQGIAYQQALACNVPILAWDRGGLWQDPSYYPHKVQFTEVSSVPYWDDRCGIKFQEISDFYDKLTDFIDKLQLQHFAPREFILENLTLEKCARQYIEIHENLQKIEK
ncbi:glycosyltransferase [Altericista sp. CCNU0014]|uniref:glycosyltransferase n=1 Tax=Altericista sp. CCNU0014 TaxID=3082949 RepID=UPI00384C5A87